MKKYEVSIVYGHSYLNTTGKSVYGDGKSRKVILRGEAENEKLAVIEANVTFGVQFKEGLIAHVYSHKIGDDSMLVLKIK